MTLLAPVGLFSSRPQRVTSFSRLLLVRRPIPIGQLSLDLLAKHLVDSNLVGAMCSISIETVSYWLRAADLKPHKVRGWLNSKDPKIQEKRDKIVELYRNPPKDGVLLSVDGKTTIQAFERVRKDQPALPGQRRRLEWEYKRHGIANLIASFNVGTGQIISEILEGKNNSEAFIKFLEKLMMLHPTCRICLILDNGTTHCSNDTKNFFKAKERLVPVFTPTHASWLNQIEIWFSVMSRHALRKVSFSSLDELRKRIESYIELHDRELALSYQWVLPPRKGGVSGALRRSSARQPNQVSKSTLCWHESYPAGCRLKAMLCGEATQAEARRPASAKILPRR